MSAKTERIREALGSEIADLLIDLRDRNDRLRFHSVYRCGGSVWAEGPEGLFKIKVEGPDDD